MRRAARQSCGSGWSAILSRSAQMKEGRREDGTMNEQPFDSLVRDAFLGENDSPLPANPTWLDAQGHISLNRVPTGIRRGWNENELTHLEQCPSCTWRLALAFRQQCPSPAMLIAYMSGVMHAVERKAIA